MAAPVLAAAGCGGSGATTASTAPARAAATAEPTLCSDRYWSKTVYLTLVNRTVVPADITADGYLCDHWSSEGGSYPIVFTGVLPGGAERRERLESRYWDTVNDRTNDFRLTVRGLGPVRVRVVEKGSRNERWFEILSDSGTWQRCGQPTAWAPLGSSRVRATFESCGYDDDNNFLARLALERPAGETADLVMTVVRSTPSGSTVTATGTIVMSPEPSSGDRECVLPSPELPVTCTATFPTGTTVNLTARPGPQSALNTWKGAARQCNEPGGPGTPPSTTCTITLKGPQTAVTAGFRPVSTSPAPTTP